MTVDPNEIPVFNYLQQFIGACAEALEVKLEEQEND